MKFIRKAARFAEEPKTQYELVQILKRQTVIFQLFHTILFRLQRDKDISKPLEMLGKTLPKAIEANKIIEKMLSPIYEKLPPK